MPNKYYLAYGSNLNLNQMRLRCPTAKLIGVALIEDYELLFKGSKSGSYLTIEKKEGESLPVGVWEIDNQCEKSLDLYEGFPNFYYKKDFEIKYIPINEWIAYLESDQPFCYRKAQAFAYIMDERRTRSTPSEYYWETCLSGYKSFGFSKSYLKDALNKSRGENYEKMPSL